MNIIATLEDADIDVTYHSNYLVAQASNQEVLRALGEEADGYGAWIYSCEGYHDVSLITIIPSRRHYIELPVPDYHPAWRIWKFERAHTPEGIHMMNTTGIRLGLGADYMYSRDHGYRTFDIRSLELETSEIETILECIPNSHWRMNINYYSGQRHLRMESGCYQECYVGSESVPVRTCKTAGYTMTVGASRS